MTTRAAWPERINPINPCITETAVAACCAIEAIIAGRPIAQRCIANEYKGVVEALTWSESFMHIYPQYSEPMRRDDQFSIHEA